MRTMATICLVFLMGCETPDTDPKEDDCIGEALSSPFTFVQDWDYLTDSHGVVFRPAVGQLTDDNGDGRIDDLDNPDIAFTTMYGDKLVALHGDGSGVIFEKPGYWGRVGVAIGDIDGDGGAEIVAVSKDLEITALDADGAEKWVFPTGFILEANLLITDLDVDGNAEVVVDGIVLDGKTGEAVFEIDPLGWRSPVAADLDGDGTLELVLGSQVYSHTGELEWQVDVAGGYLGTFAEVVNIDDDPGLETVFVIGNNLNTDVIVHDDDGTLIHHFEAPVGRAGTPAVADLDGDGDLEIAVSGTGFLSVHSLDGTQIWQAEVVDVLGLKGVTAYDFDWDGASELVFADADSLRIFDGAEGDVLFQDTDHISTLQDFSRPQVVDLNNDDVPEIIVANNNWPTTGDTGVSVYHTPGNGWVNICD